MPPSTQRHVGHSGCPDELHPIMAFGLVAVSFHSSTHYSPSVLCMKHHQKWKGKDLQDHPAQPSTYHQYIPTKPRPLVPHHQALSQMIKPPTKYQQVFRRWNLFPARPEFRSQKPMKPKHRHRFTGTKSKTSSNVQNRLSTVELNPIFGMQQIPPEPQVIKLRLKNNEERSH